MRNVLEPNPRQAKFAARLLAFSKNRDEACAAAVNVNLSLSPSLVNSPTHIMVQGDCGRS